MFGRIVSSINRFFLRFRKHRFPAATVLLLASRCLHRSECGLDVENDIALCARCGKCNVKDLAEISLKYGLRCKLSRGGREAVGYAREPGVKGIIAIACPKELALGILAVFPKPVIAIPNCQPNGACKDTRVNIDAVLQAVKEMVAS